MAVFLVLLIPLLLMMFALLMERVENRLRHASMSEDEISEFLQSARPDEVNTFIREGWTRALSRFRLRRRAGSHAQRGRGDAAPTDPA